MFKLIRYAYILLISTTFLAAAGIGLPQPPPFSRARASQMGVSPVLSGAASYLVLGGSIVTNSGPSVVS